MGLNRDNGGGNHAVIKGKKGEAGVAESPLEAAGIHVESAVYGNYGANMGVSVEHHIRFFCGGLPGKLIKATLHAVAVSMGQEKFLSTQIQQDLSVGIPGDVAVAGNLDHFLPAQQLQKVGIVDFITQVNNPVHPACQIEGLGGKGLIAVGI